jgi:phosphoribosyl 1,2-cyclic phosphodiesterase
MGLRFSFLGSGSRGNCTLVESDHWKFLIDLGFGLRRTNEALCKCGISIENISAAIVTHTHDDHVKKSMIKRIYKSNVVLHCCPEHESRIGNWDGYQYLQAKHLVRYYSNETYEMLPGLRVKPFPVSHDSPATHGFVFDFKLGSSDFRFAYAADCGHASLPTLKSELNDADLLALEFNHDEEMERQSGRPYFLINRVLGPEGHLSNVRAARLLADIRASRLRNVVQLHLSNDCNRPELAMKTAKTALPKMTIHQTLQDRIGPIIEIN